MWVSELEVLVIVTGLHRMGNISEVPRTHIKENCLTNAHHMVIHVLQYRTFKWTAKRVNVSYSYALVETLLQSASGTNCNISVWVDAFISNLEYHAAHLE